MPSTWLNKYGYGSSNASTQPMASTKPIQTKQSPQPVQSSQPTWTAKYGTIKAGSPAPASPAFANAQQNQNAPAMNTPAFNNAQNIQNMQASIVKNSEIPQQPKNIFQKATDFLTKAKNKLPDLADKFTKAIKNLPEAHFADDENVFTPVGFTKSVAQSIVNTPSQAFKGAASLGENIGAGTSTPKQVAGDVAAALQLPLLILSGGGSGIIKAGGQTTIKGVAKVIGKEAITGAGFGALSGFQTGKEIEGVPNYLKNFLANVGIGSVAGAGLKATGMVVAPLAKGLSNKLGAVFVKNGDKPQVTQIRLDPKVAQTAIIANDLEKTPIGKAVLKGSMQASEEGGHVAIIPTKAGKYELPGGGKANIEVAPIYDPLTIDKTTQPSAKILANGTQKETLKTQIPQETQAGVIKSNQNKTGQSLKDDFQVSKTQIDEGEVKTAKLGLRVEQTAIEKKLTSELSELPQYKSINMKDQAEKATALIKSDPEKAFRIALGQETAPNGLTPESVFKAVESTITTPEDAVRLANSSLVTEASTLGQRIKSLDVKTSESPVEAIRQVINARSKAIEGKSGSIEKAITKTTEDIKKKIKTPDKYDWNSFITSIQC